ncbi:sugar transferase, partial [Clostridium perfringens]|nr:sugar transferase [Clostridium perfringens]
MQNINDISVKSECNKEKSYLFYNFIKRTLD